VLADKGVEKAVSIHNDSPATIVSKLESLLKK
jgi:hypothetical protein